MIDLKTFFERCYVVNLDRRSDRYADFCQRCLDWPFVEIQRAAAVDGRLVPHARWWSAGGGAWGCYRSHAGLIEKCLNENVRSVLLMEDDAFLCDNFTDRARAFLENVPADWQMLYLGGQHLFAKIHPPQKINDWVFQPHNVNRTHAFALSREGMKIAYRHLYQHDWRKHHHIDHHFGRMHMTQKIIVYTPGEWLVGQAEGKSNISGRKFDTRFWPAAAKYQGGDAKPAKPRQSPYFLAIVGLHSSGSSAIAGVCYHLGVHLGNKLSGYYGNKPNKSCGFECRGWRGFASRHVRLVRPNSNGSRICFKKNWLLGSAIGKRKDAKDENSLAVNIRTFVAWARFYGEFAVTIFWSSTVIDR